MTPGTINTTAPEKPGLFRSRIGYWMLIATLALIATNIYLMHHSVPESVRDQYPVLKTAGNIFYYSALPFLVVLPAAAFVMALLLALVPLKGFRYRARLLPAFLVVLLILQMIAMVMLAVK